MEYDNQSRRVSAAVARWTGTAFEPIYKLLHHYDDWNQIAETLEQGTPIRAYIWGPDLSGNLRGAGGVGGLLRMTDLTSEDSNSYAYTYDGNGNVTNLWALADATVAATYRYGGFGETLEATGAVAEFNPVRFSTKCELPESVNLNYYGFRFYNSDAGRWVNRDPPCDLAFRNRVDQELVSDWRQALLQASTNPLRSLDNNTNGFIDVLGLAKQAICRYQVSGGHTNQVAVDERFFAKLKQPCDSFSGAACFRNSDGDAVWALPEERDKHSPSEPTMGEELTRLIGEAEQEAEKACDERDSCCARIDITVSCLQSEEMKKARTDEQTNDACNYRNTLTCGSKKWLKPKIK